MNACVRVAMYEVMLSFLHNFWFERLTRGIWLSTYY